MRQPAEQVELGLDPAQDLLVRDQELDVARRPEVADAGAAEVANEADVGDEEAGEKDEDERGGPGRNFVGADAGEGLVCGG